ncbi:MAG: hypothetical protein FJ304_04905 [Planctomycetes bacterium]|nr:hypothetical protein [Planctomycetota bacterium]
MVASLLMVGALAAAYEPEPDVHTVPGPNFQIPCKLAALKDDAKNVDSVRLFVSRDRGQMWELYETITPDKTAFTFCAKKPGEYWFTAQVKAKDGTLNPANPAEFAPMQKVRVATGTESDPLPPPFPTPAVQPRRAADREVAELEDDLTRAELELIRKEIKRLTEETKLTPDVEAKIDRLRARLRDLRERLWPNRPSAAPPLTFPDPLPPLPAPKPDDGRLPSSAFPIDPLIVPVVRPVAPTPRAQGQR